MRVIGAPENPRVTTRDRLVTTLFFAILVHGMIILGISFSAQLGKPPQGPTIEVTLVQGHSATPPAHADYLAQANQQGEGNTKEQVRPKSPISTPSVLENAGISDATDLINNTDPSKAKARPDTTRAPNPPADVEQQVLTQSQSDLKALSHPIPPASNDQRRLLVARLMTRTQDTADPTDDDELTAQATSRDPRDRFISVNTRESRFARYLDAWRAKVERVGNLNYPDDIQRKGLTGSLALEVALNADGSIRKIITRRASRYPELDQAAIRTVKMAAPFKPFPPDIRKDTDVLRFVYEWRFIDGKARAGRLALPGR